MKNRIQNLLKNPLIMVIDMQNVYSNGQKWECSNFNKALENITLLLDNSTNSNTIFTRYIASENPKGIWADYNYENAEVNSDSWSNEIIDDLKKYTNTFKVIDKDVYSSLSSNNVKKDAEASSCVVVTGVVAECCVLSTVMSLIDAGIYVVYLKDAIAGVNNETEEATIKILEGLVPLHLSIMDTNEYLDLKKSL